MRFTPILDRILVKLEEPPKIIGRIILSDNAKVTDHQMGVIVAVGAGKKSQSGTRVAMTVVAGERILFDRMTGAEVKIDGEDFLIMSEDQILGVL